MPPAMLNLNGQRFVVIPEKEYREYQALKKTNKSKPAAKRPAKTARAARMTKQDEGDVAESMRRLAEPGRRVSAAEVFRKLGV
jgi:hypothetical protein